MHSSGALDASLVGSAYSRPVVEAGPLAPVAHSALLNASSRTLSRQASEPALGHASSPVLGAVPRPPPAVRTGAITQLQDARVAEPPLAPGLPHSLQLFWAMHPESCPVRSTFDFRVPAPPADSVLASSLRSSLSTSALVESSSSSSSSLQASTLRRDGPGDLPPPRGVSLSSLVAAGTRAGHAAEDVLTAVRALPEGRGAPVLIPAAIQEGLEARISAAAHPPPSSLSVAGGPRPANRAAAVAAAAATAQSGARLSAMSLPSVAALRASRRYNRAVALIQGTLRMRVQRKWYLRLRETVVLLQRWSRFNLARELRKRLLQSKRDVATELLNKAMAVAICIPVGNQLRAARFRARLALVFGVWKRWSIGALRGNRIGAQRKWYVGVSLVIGTAPVSAFDACLREHCVVSAAGLCMGRNFMKRHFRAFSSVALEDARVRKGLAARQLKRRRRIQRTVLKLLLRRAEFRTFVRWKRRRQMKRIKWMAFRGWVDAIHTQRDYVVVVQRAARRFLALRRRKARKTIVFAVALWAARMKLRWKKQDAAEKCVLRSC